MRLLQAELVALRIVHNDPVLAALLDGVSPGRPEPDEALDLSVDAPAPLLDRGAVAAADVDFEVHAVLDALRLRDLLEEDARRLAVRVDDPAGGVPLLLGDALVRQKSRPAREARRRILLLVAERRRPEGGQTVGVCAVEGHLE